jgi:hypothetical protein
MMKLGMTIILDFERATPAVQSQSVLLMGSYDMITQGAVHSEDERDFGFSNPFRISSREYLRGFHMAEWPHDRPYKRPVAAKGLEAKGMVQ